MWYFISAFLFFISQHIPLAAFFFPPQWTTPCSPLIRYFLTSCTFTCIFFSAWIVLSLSSLNFLILKVSQTHLKCHYFLKPSLLPPTIFKVRNRFFFWFLMFLLYPFVLTLKHCCFSTATQESMPKLNDVKLQFAVWFQESLGEKIWSGHSRNGMCWLDDFWNIGWVDLGMSLAQFLNRASSHAQLGLPHGMGTIV